MTPEVVWTWAAEAEMQKFFGEWEDRQDGGGMKLLLRVEKATELLLRSPHMAPAWREPIRRLVIRRSSLGLFYVPEPRGIIVLAVVDLRQDPERIQQEIRSRLP
jgi:plasmid stabilization system protein ParE